MNQNQLFGTEYVLKWLQFIYVVFASLKLANQSDQN